MSMDTRRGSNPGITGRRVESVTVDDQGRLFGADGQQVIVPGLEPEKVKRALAQDESGKGHLITAETREEFLAKLNALIESGA